MAVTTVTPDARPRRLARLRILPRRAVVAIAVPVVLLGVGALGALGFDRAFTDRILPGVQVAGIDAGGLTAAELTSRLEGLPVARTTVEVVTGGRTVTVAATDLGRRVDVAGAVSAAMTAGRAAGPLADLPERLGILTGGRSIELPVDVDRNAVSAWVSLRAEALEVEPVSAQIVATPAGWAATTARDGRSLDRAAAIRSIESLLRGGAVGAARVELPLVSVTPRIDRLDAIVALAAAERASSPLTVVFRDDASWVVPGETIRAAIRFDHSGDRPLPLVETAAFDGLLAEISDRINRPANETMILRGRGGSAFGFVPGKNGRFVDVAATAHQIQDLVAARALGTATLAETAPVVLGVVPPKLTAEQAAQTTHQVNLVGSWTTRFTSSERNGFGNNIRIPAKLIDGTVIGPGQVFDFWKAVGPVTTARGFRMGGIIESGRTNPTGAIGGGICSASTTIFNAAARAGYEILERDNHSYYIPRYPLGLDATVSKKGGVSIQNFRFRNDTSNALYIRGLSGPGFVRFEIYSVPNGRTVTFSSPQVSNVRQAIDTTVETTAMKRGTRERLESPSNGMSVVVTRTVRDASGRVVNSDRWVSHYIKVDGVTMIGVG